MYIQCKIYQYIWIIQMNSCKQNIGQSQYAIKIKNSINLFKSTLLQELVRMVFKRDYYKINIIIRTKK